jgi:hypothetical protein
MSVTFPAEDVVSYNRQNNNNCFVIFTSVWLLLIGDHCSHEGSVLTSVKINSLTLKLNPSAQRCLPIFFTGDFDS